MSAPVLRVIAFGAATVVAFDAAPAIAARVLDLDYSALFPVSLLIYCATAFIATRLTGRVRSGAIAGGAVALTDATVGWALSWAIGPGAPDADLRSPYAILATIVVVVTSGVVLGAIGGLIERLAARRSA